MPSFRLHISMPTSSSVPTPPPLKMQKSAASNHFWRKCRDDSWKVLKKSTPSSGGCASSSRKHAPVSAPLPRAWSVASRITPPPPPVGEPAGLGPDEAGELVDG